MRFLSLVGPATETEFSPAGYLLINSDVQQAPHSSPDGQWARWHFEAFGAAEGRLQLDCSRLAEMVRMRSQKMDWLWERSPGSLEVLQPYSFECCGTTLDSMKVVDPRLPVPFERVSDWGFDKKTEEWVDSQPEALFLDLGSGLCHDYRPNVIYTEIAALPTVDILCFGEALPFEDGTFDGIVSLAVLEHVQDPFAVSAELMRVLRPGGGMVVEWPFLQPVHGYPHHYFNATPEGARLVFERLGASVTSSVPVNLHPLSTLYWFLSDWNAGLPEAEQHAFQSLTIGEVLSVADSHEFIDSDWVKALNPETQMTIASGTRLEITKPK